MRCAGTSNYVYFNGTVHTYAALHRASRNIFLFLLARLVLAQHSVAQRSAGQCSAAQRMCERAIILSRHLNNGASHFDIIMTKVKWTMLIAPVWSIGGVLISLSVAVSP